MLSVNNIVKVNLDIVTADKILGDFQTTVYFAPVTLQDENANIVKQLLLTSADLVDVLLLNNDAVNVSVKNYFENGGQQLLIVNPSAYTLEGFKADLERVRKITKDFVYVAISNQIVDTAGYSIDTLESIANYCDNTTSPEKVRLILTVKTKDFLEKNNFTNHLLVAKYCTKVGGTNAQIIDAGLLVGAYFSQVDLDGTNTLKDYAFTEETLINIADTSVAENLTQEEYEALVNNSEGQGYYNVIDSVGNKVVNLGGNLATTKGISLHTDFGTIAVERDLTYSVLEKMLGKQYLTEAGISAVKSAINTQLQRYKSNGFLNTDAKYSGDDLAITYNNIKYNVIKNGDSLAQGFYIFSVPMSAITTADKQAKKFTPIYVILETQDGARIVEITGEVR